MADDVRLSGTVRGLQNRTDVSGGGSDHMINSVHTMLFRLEPSVGGPPVLVELRGSRINGTVVEGERVDVIGTYNRRGTVRAKSIVSHETGATIDTKLPAGAYVLGVFVLILFLGVVVFIGTTIFRGNDIASPGAPPTPVAPSAPRPSRSGFEDMRDKAYQQCLADPNFTDEQCRHVYGN